VPTASESPLRSPLQPAGFFALRSPLLPFDEILAWTLGLRAVSLPVDSEELENALAGDRDLLRARLRVVLERPEVWEAVYLASPDLVDSIPFWRRDPASDRGQKVEKALVRYFFRMAGRPTPFGLFAGCSTVLLGKETRLELGSRDTYARHTRLDMDYLFLLADTLQRRADLRSLVPVRPNSSLFRGAGRFRYAEAKLRGKARTYQLVAVDDSDYLRATLTRAQDGARPADLAAALCAEDADIAPEEAQAFVDVLIDSQILVSDLVPPVTGPEPVHDLLGQLSGLEPAGNVCQCLERTVAALEEIDRQGLGVDPGRYRAIASDLGSLSVKTELARLFQVDMIKPVAHAGLGERVLADLIQGVHLLHRLGRWSSGPTSLERFRDAFVSRYEAREVPLVEALDEELGVGFESPSQAGAEASPLLEDLVFRTAPPNSTMTWDEQRGYLFLKLEECIRSGSREWTLSPDDVDRLAPKDPLPLPDALAISVILGAASEQALAQGDYEVYLAGGVGPSGARLFGRFCHVDARLAQLVREHCRVEEALDPEAIFAEIVHLPEGRTGNVLCRPVLRDYEIPFLGRSGAPAERQIPISDLLVSVRGDQVVLRSRRLGRRVIPRLSTAHNFNARALRLYKFLCCLQEQGLSHALAWDWGIFQHAQFLPRVRLGRLILSRACWRLNGNELQALGKLSGTALFRSVQTRRAERGWPRWAFLSDGDQELPIDFDNVLSIETFVDLAKGRPQALLMEMFPDPERLVVRGPEGRFVHEMVIPFARKKEPAQRVARASTAMPQPVPRLFPPGSEWLYVKLYTGPATADQVLRDVVSPITRDALAQGAADGWFFLRYSDPDWHVRWRIHGDPIRLREDVMPRLEEAVQPLLDDGRIHKVQVDTYQREVERYGGPEGILLAERVFQVDSAAVLGIVELLSGEAGVDARWRLTLRGMDMLLDDLGLTWDEKRTVMKTARASFSRDFPADVRQLGAKFRREKANFEKLLDRAFERTNPLAAGFRLLQRRREQLVPIAAELRAAIAQGRVSLSLPLLCGSFIHLHANRLLRSAQRAQEYVIYFFLDRWYESVEARAKAKG
jgi:thiopeptide-type bacteriocin biosynthesis protein